MNLFTDCSTLKRKKKTQIHEVVSVTEYGSGEGDIVCTFDHVSLCVYVSLSQR